MFDKGEKIYYIDTHDGTVQEGKFLESTGDGIWLRLKGAGINTFVYSDVINEKVFKDRFHAETGLESLKKGMKARLLDNNRFIDDILGRLRKSEGELYLHIIEEVLREKTGSASNSR